MFQARCGAHGAPPFFMPETLPNLRTLVTIWLIGYRCAMTCTPMPPIVSARALQAWTSGYRAGQRVLRRMK